MSVTFSPSLCRLRRNGSGYGKEKAVPTVTGPALGVSRLILIGREPAQPECFVPLHVDDQHIQRHIVLAKTAYQLIKFLIGVGPVARPPGTKGEAWWQRNRAGDLDEVGERLLVVMAISKEIPVLTLARGTEHHPGPRAALAMQKLEVGGIEERPRRVVDQSPAIAGDQAWFDRFLGLAAERAVQRARRTLQVAGIRHARMPGHRLSIQLEGDRQIFSGEAAIAARCRMVAQQQRVSLDRDVAQFIVIRSEVGNRKLAVQENQRGMVLELAIGRPFHADKLWREDGKAGMACDYFGL